MKTNLKSLLLLLSITFLLVPSCWAQTKSGGEIRIKLSHAYPTDYIRHLSSVVFKELLEKETNGRVVVDIYPARQLYKSSQEGEALAMGNIDMVACAGITTYRLVPEWGVFTLPVVWNDMDHIVAFEDSAVCRQYMTSKLEPKGIKFISFMPSCVGGGVGLTKPVRTIKDFKGLKIHTAFGKLNSLFFGKLGATCQNVPIVDRIMALSTGMVDGEMGNMDNTLSQGYPVKYYLDFSEDLMVSHGGASLLMNQDFWNRLPSDIKEAVEKAASGARGWCLKRVFEINDAAKKGLQSRGIEIIDISPEMKDQINVTTGQFLKNVFTKRFSESGPPILAEIDRLNPNKR